MSGQDSNSHNLAAEPTLFTATPRCLCGKCLHRSLWIKHSAHAVAMELEGQREASRVCFEPLFSVEKHQLFTGFVTSVAFNGSGITWQYFVEKRNFADVPTQTGTLPRRLGP